MPPVTKSTNDNLPNWVWGLIAVLSAGAFVLGLNIPFVGPDEPRYAQVGREMFLTGDLITPRLAGYHWFGDWGRDTFIALPGLARLTGRHDVAREVLRSWARAVSQGMLPNRFPDSGAPLGEGDFNTIDATLWFVRAIGEIDALGGAPRGTELSKELWPAVNAIVDAHLTGTRHGIGMDPTDGLLRTSDGQLTWMDARVDGEDQTPRAGKPVEVNALWIHALDRAVTWARAAGDTLTATRYKAALDLAMRSFPARFWWAGTGPGAHGIVGTGGYLFDCIDGPNGNDASLRPNQVIEIGRAHV